MMAKTTTPSTSLFYLILILSTLMMITSSNWITLWMSMEMNLMSIIPLILSSHKSYELEAATKYFLVQAIGSALMLMSVFMFNSSHILNFSSLMFISSMILKMGMVPFHIWFPQVLNHVSWKMVLLISTWQKVGPLTILSYTSYMWSYETIASIAVANSVIGSWGGVSQTQIQPLISYSSISHMGWMVSGLILSPSLPILYLALYSTVSLFTIMPFIISEKQSSSKFNQTRQPSSNMNTATALNLLSLGGMPPLLGFIPKWLMVSQLISTSPILILTLLATSLVSLFFYMKIMMNISTNTNKSLHTLMNTNLLTPLLFQSIVLTTMLFTLTYDK